MPIKDFEGKKKKKGKYPEKENFFSLTCLYNFKVLKEQQSSRAQ